jgi:hypothetical protein
MRFCKGGCIGRSYARVNWVVEIWSMRLICGRMGVDEGGGVQARYSRQLIVHA